MMLHGNIAFSQKAAITLLVSFSSLAATEDPQRANAEEALPVALPAGLTARDWTSIRAAYEAGRHAIQTVEGEHRVRNPGQRWTTYFDGRAFLTMPHTVEWSWGLELVRYGWGELERTVDVSRSVTREGGRLADEWDERLTEWYVNDTRGLEHGYTLRERPAEAEGLLTLELAVRGDLHADVAANGRDVRFVDGEGDVVLVYSGLVAFDADACSLDASFELRGHELVLRVEDEGARYPLTIDPVAQQAYLKASNTGAGDWFGESVAISGDTVVVGAPWEDSAGTGVNGDQSTNYATDSGAAYVFVRDGTSWSQQAYLKASNAGRGDYFGWSVAISGDSIVVGAPGEDSNATGVNGDGGDNSFVDSGAAYIFVRNGTNWSQEAYLKASNTGGGILGGSGDIFGHSVAISGDTVVVGASAEDSNATGVNGDQADNSLQNSGAAYVFARDGTSWSQDSYVLASNSGWLELFGSSVAISGDTIVVGAYLEDSSATGVNGDQSDNSATGSGATYIFIRNTVGWSQLAYLKASNSDPQDQFGYSVAISDETVLVGAQREDSNATGVNGDGTNDNVPNSGAAYVFDLAAPDPITPLCFGDGSGAPCPCGNAGGLGRGCANSAGPGGLLEASGSTSIGALDLVLSGTGLVPGEAGLYFQGDQALAGGAGIPFGDGLRCAGGNVVRLETRIADAFGVSSTTIDIATAGGVLPGDTRTYQLYYRDPAPSPCGSGFNLTNALQVVWTQ